MAEVTTDPLSDWFRKIGTGLSIEDYEEGVRLIHAAHDADVARVQPSPESIEEAYQRGHEDGFWNGRTTEMTPAQAAAFMAPYRATSGGRTEPTVDDLIGTRVGLALAKGAWSEGAAAVQHAAVAALGGVACWHSPVNPYSAPLLRVINEEADRG